MGTSNYLYDFLKNNLDSESLTFLEDKVSVIAENKSVKDLYMTYSMLSKKVDSKINIDFGSNQNESVQYSGTKMANALEVARIYLLARVLESDTDFFLDKVANIIQVADTTELETFLKFLTLLPGPENFKATAVEALRSNIATIFNAIALNNPYPAQYFDDQQWNQMYLKATFIGSDLSLIVDVDERANEDLTRIISDYAHERWAASRKIDPLFWRPVTKFFNKTILSDMERLLSSSDVLENRAGALCCYYSGNAEANDLLNKYENLRSSIATSGITWNTFQN